MLRFRRKRTPFIDRLPHEVLANILIHVPHTLFANEPYPRPSTIMRLGHVSRSWRAVVYSTTELWTALTILWGSHEEEMDDERKMVTKWLSHSQNLPLSLIVKSRYCLLSTECVTTIMNVIVPHISRCKHLNLDIKADADFKTIMSMLPSFSANSLESLAFQAYSTEEGDVYNWDFCAGSERLTTIRMYGNSTGIPGLSTSYLPWHQIQHLEIQNPINIMEANRILQLCLPLLSASFHIERDTFTIIDPLPIYLPNLTSLSVTIGLWPMFSTFMTPFYDSLTLPSLTHLKAIRTSLNDRYEILPALVSLIRRSDCKLNYLNLSCTLEEETDDLFELLRCTPHLVEFELLDIVWIYIPLRPWRSFDYPGDGIVQELLDMIKSGKLSELQRLNIGLLISDAAALRLSRCAAEKKMMATITMITPGLSLRLRNRGVEGVKICSKPPRDMNERIARWIR